MWTLSCVSKLFVPTLMTILRIHFKEKDATAVFNEMSNASQGPKENEHSFCMKMMGLRDKVMLLTEEEGNLYDARLVQTQFQHALYTGFRCENARHVKFPGAELSQCRENIGATLRLSAQSLLETVAEITKWLNEKPYFRRILYVA